MHQPPITTTGTGRWASWPKLVRIVNWLEFHYCTIFGGGEISFLSTKWILINVTSGQCDGIPDHMDHGRSPGVQHLLLQANTVYVRGRALRILDLLVLFHSSQLYRACHMKCHLWTGIQKQLFRQKYKKLIVHILTILEGEFLRYLHWDLCVCISHGISLKPDVCATYNTVLQQVRPSKYPGKRHPLGGMLALGAISRFGFHKTHTSKSARAVQFNYSCCFWPFALWLFHGDLSQPSSQIRI